MADEHTESMYRAYVRERVGNWMTGPMSHAQIVADGVFGAEVEAFGLRYSLEVSAYADAMVRRDQLTRITGRETDVHTSPYGHRYRTGQ